MHSHRPTLEDYAPTKECYVIYFIYCVQGKKYIFMEMKIDKSDIIDINVIIGRKEF